MVVNQCTANSLVQGISCISTMSTYKGVSMFGITILLLLWTVLFFRLKDTEGTKNAIASTTFFVSMIALVIGLLGKVSGAYLLSDSTMGIILVIGLVSLIPIINRYY